MRKYIFIILFCGVLFIHKNAYSEVTEDNKITELVQDLLLQEKDIPVRNLKIKTKNRIVIIGGAVDTRLQASKIIELASSVTNVIDVQTTDLGIKSSKEFLSDAYITAKAKGKIKFLAVSGQISQGYELHLETTNGVVHIFGHVLNDKDAKIIKESIKNIIDVKNVKINIKCK